MGCAGVGICFGFSGRSVCISLGDASDGKKEGLRVSREEVILGPLSPVIGWLWEL